MRSRPGWEKWPLYVWLGLAGVILCGGALGIPLLAGLRLDDTRAELLTDLAIVGYALSLLAGLAAWMDGLRSGKL